MAINPDFIFVCHYFDSVIATTSRPLYQPQWGQIWCGNLGSWQCGQSTILGFSSFQ
jgi:hypothetical protein